MKGGIAAAICALDALDERRSCPPPATWCSIWWPTRSGEAGTGPGPCSRRGLIRGRRLPGARTHRPAAVHGGAGPACRRGSGSRAGPGTAAAPGRAVSAIEHAAKLVLALHAADFGDPEHPLLGRPTANVGTIAGGTTFNTVAESCVIGLDRRVLPGATAGHTEAEIRRRIDAAGVDGLRYDFEVDMFGEASEMAGRLSRGSSSVGDAVASAPRDASPDIIGMTLHHRRPLRPQPGGYPDRRVRPGRGRAGARQRRVRHRGAPGGRHRGVRRAASPLRLRDRRQSQARQPFHDDAAGPRSRTAQAVVLAVEPLVGDGTGDRRGGCLELRRASRRRRGSRRRTGRALELGKVLRPQALPVGPAGAADS